MALDCSPTGFLKLLHRYQLETVMTPIEPWAGRGMVPKVIHVILTNLKEDHLMMLFIKYQGCR